MTSDRESRILLRRIETIGDDSGSRLLAEKELMREGKTEEAIEPALGHIRDAQLRLPEEVGGGKSRATAEDVLKETEEIDALSAVGIDKHIGR